MILYSFVVNYIPFGKPQTITGSVCVGGRRSFHIIIILIAHSYCALIGQSEDTEACGEYQEYLSGNGKSIITAPELLVYSADGEVDDRLLLRPLLLLMLLAIRSVDNIEYG